MKIANNSVVTLHYLVKDKEGTDIDSSFDGEPLVFLQGQGFLIKGLEEALTDRQAGEKFSVAVDAENAYGERHDGFVQEVPLSMFEGFEDQIHIGMQLRASTDGGEQTVIVVDVAEDTVTVDGNHPLAGIDLEFDVEIVDVRAATEEEIKHGHVHQEKASCCNDSGCSSNKH
ncbi:peptidylprolyl isomerase [Saccharobesus litoralis]|uniref:Peptidyl-prolyl cis-trans isomerase n=1 Tax=Saccharobesus litoralis TaxID=2172099 RepID=A0A2S0VS86_9ALTE|nr:peptidylprolyl isomerase [Saccharobesus litoralis]AWB67053.1 peptidylprolyl isomerase [Saccharobesus litoralis]